MRKCMRMQKNANVLTLVKKNVKVFAISLTHRQKLMLESTHGCETSNVLRQKKNLKTPVQFVLKGRLVGRVEEEQSNVSFDSRVHL